MAFKDPEQASSPLSTQRKTMRNESVIFYNKTSPLYLNEIKRDKDGRIKKGYVINGNWIMRIKKGMMRAEDGFGNVINEWPDAPFPEFRVPEEMSYDYNKVISWAKDQLETKP